MRAHPQWKVGREVGETAQQGVHPSVRPTTSGPRAPPAPAPRSVARPRHTGTDPHTMRASALSATLTTASASPDESSCKDGGTRCRTGQRWARASSRNDPGSTRGLAGRTRVLSVPDHGDRVRSLSGERCIRTCLRNLPTKSTGTLAGGEWALFATGDEASAPPERQARTWQRGHKARQPEGDAGVSRRIAVDECLPRG